MASSSDGASAPLLPAMPDYSTPSFSHSTAGELKHQLQALLDSKERQLQSTATLGQRVLAQQMELEERIRHLQEITLDKGEDEDVDSETRQKLRELGDTIRTWDSQNAQLSSAFGTPSRHTAFPPSVRLNDMPREEPERLKSSTSAAQSRRAKNAAHRADDVEFAFEIGSGLLTEVRRLQSLLAERDKVIQDMKEEKDDLEKSVANLQTTLRQLEQSADKYKEENWNLEVTLQELRTLLTDAQGTNQRLEGEQKRLTKLLANTRDTSEQQKNDIDRLQTTMEEMKAKHETDIAQARKISAGLQRDKSDLQQSIDALKAEQARNARRLPRFGTPVTPNGSTQDLTTTPGTFDDDDVFSGGASTSRRKTDPSALYPDKISDYADSSPDASPARPFLAPNHPSNEVEALQQRLAHAQRQINTLKGSLQREKELKMEYRRKLEASTGEVEDDEEEVEDENVPQSIPAKTKRGSALRSGGSRLGNRRGRGRGGLTLFQRLAASSPASEFNDETSLSTSPPPVPPIPLDFEEEGEEVDAAPPAASEREQRSPSPSPFDPPMPNRASIDGMDPAFANVLKRTSSTNSIPHARSPLRPAFATRGGSLGRRRGGAAYQDIRPPSLIGHPEVLSAELGFGGTPMKDTSIYEEVVRQTADFACQTEVVETLPPPPPIPVTSEVGVQIEPPPEPTVPTVEMACQTEETPVRRSDFAVQYTYVEPKPLLVSTSMSTDPEPARPIMAQAEVQSIAPLVHDVDTQTAPVAVKLDAESQTTPPPSQPSTPRRDNISLGSAGDTSITPTRRTFAVYMSDDDGEETETPADSDTEAETETDIDDYEDAPQSMVPTPSASVDDFHSLKTMSDTEDDDDVSIKASRLPSRQDYSTAPSSVSSYASLSQAFSEPAPEAPRVSQEVQAVRAVTYDSKSVIAVPPPEPVPEVKPPVELKEMSIQTDEWKPPPPVAAPVPQSVSNGPIPGFGLYRVAPATGQQIQFVPTPPPPPAQPPPTAPALISGFRDVSHIRRQSTESTRSSILNEDLFTRPSSAMAVDKTRPPMMMLPPPPRMPPPPSSMPPPAFIPEKRVHKSSAGSREMPPPRPSSPPPAELIQRATTPTFGSILNVPGRSMMRQHGSSLPSHQPLYQPPSTSSFRSVPNTGAYGQGDSSGMSSLAARDRGRERSTTSLTSERSMASPRSSISSEQHVFRNQILPNHPTTPSRSANVTSTSSPPKAASTDPEVIHSITQTMIGEFLYKYTRRAIGKGHTNARHKRFFWVHPYTKTLYWSDADPGSSKVSESSAKSSYIEGVRSVLDPNPMPPGLYQYSIVVSTPQRDMKITAPTKERHDIWLNALRYLLTRSGGAAGVPQSPMSGSSMIEDEQQRNVFASPQSQKSSRSRATEWSATPRGQRSRSQLSARGSLGKRSGTPAAEYLRWSGPESPHSPSKSFENAPAQDDDDLDFALHSDSMSDEGFEGLENVRTCCNGRHTVGAHHHHDLPGDPPPEPEPAARPVSPSAWSFRSRSGSTHSRDATSLFSWGKAEGKMRFGSRRSAKTVVLNDGQ